MGKLAQLLRLIMLSTCFESHSTISESAVAHVDLKIKK
jgi:hypothetical protein